MFQCVCTRTPFVECRLGNDQGRSVSAWGYWGDILNSPYHSFGTACEEESLFKISNKQHTHTAVDVAQYNVRVCKSHSGQHHVQQGLLYTAACCA